ncbi:MAG: cell division protein FtsQ [Alphaproteobacteria bacterium]
MSYSAAQIDRQFVRPAEVASLPGGEHLRATANDATHSHDPDFRIRQAAVARRSSRMRRVLPLAIAAFAALTFSLLTEGGRQARQAAPLTSYLGQGLEKLGLGLSEVVVKGQRETRDSAIYDQLRLNDSRSIWLLDTEAARRRIEALPWVLKASLKRVFPDQLHIVIRERMPRAIWNDGTRTVLIDMTGRVLGAVGSRETTDLPTVFGKGAAGHASTIVEMINRMPGLRGKVGIYEWAANRRWTLHLKSGRQILLPVSGLSLAVVRLTKGGVGRRLLDTNFEKLDLRLKGQVAMEFRQ